MDFIKAGKDGKVLCGDREIIFKGFGINGWLLPEGYMWKLFSKCDRPRRLEALVLSLCGEEYAESFWKRYYDTFFTEEDIKHIADEGFNSVRLPVNARPMRNADGSLNEEYMKYVDNCIDWCERYGIYVVLDMHAAPGGQTGQNIDDSEDDLPRLYMEERYRDELVDLWGRLAERYADRAVVAGYDLLNEPLPKWNARYYPLVVPLYKRLIKEIRSKDKKHMIILEGVHWATDPSVLGEFTKEEASDNMMLQFHKYWSPPDKEGIESYIGMGERLDIPVFMGEGGENSLAWYTSFFPMLERNGIGWSFWSYKKMECGNSPVSFDKPRGWDRLFGYIDGDLEISRAEACRMFDEFLINCGSRYYYNEPVICALERRVPVRIPCEAYDGFNISSKRVEGARFRENDPVTILFENGRVGEINYTHVSGDDETQREAIFVRLCGGDSVSYRIRIPQAKQLKAAVVLKGEGTLTFSAFGEVQKSPVVEGENAVFLFDCPQTGETEFSLGCSDGWLLLNSVTVSEA